MAKRVAPPPHPRRLGDARPGLSPLLVQQHPGPVRRPDHTAGPADLRGPDAACDARADGHPGRLRIPALPAIRPSFGRAAGPEPLPSNSHPLRDIQEGLAFVWNQPLLRTLAWVSACWHLLFYGYTALHVIFATRVLGMTPGTMGMANMLGGLGVLAASLLVKPLSRRWGTGGGILVGLCVSALGFALVPAIPAALFGSAAWTVAAYAVVVFWIDCGATQFFVPYIALRQRVTPDAVLGRMVATMRALTVAAAPLGALLAGGMGEGFGVRAGLGCIAAGAVVLAAGGIFGTRLKDANA